METQTDHRSSTPMSKRVVSFTKQTGQVTPYWLLQQMGEIDAVLIFKFANHCANIKYDIPAERQPRAAYLREIVNGASDDFRSRYVNEIWDLLVLPRNECPAVNVSEIRVPLRPIFSGEFQSGRAAACFNFVCESLGKLPRIVEFGSPQHLQRIELEAIRDRIFRIDQDQDANWKAEYDYARAF